MDKERENQFQKEARRLSGHNLIAHHLNGLRLAIIEHSENTGKWLAAVALAASTPHDNSEEVQKQIDKYADEIRSIRTDLAQSVNNQTEGE